MTETSTRIFIFLLGIACGVVALSLWPSVPAVAPPVTLETGSTTTETSSSTPPIPSDISGALSVSDQKAGMEVIVDSVTVTPPGVWVAVHETTEGKLGNILGAAHVRGPLSPVEVPLLRATLPGHSYAVVLYRDDGDDKFSLGKDSVYVDFDTGASVIAPFTAK